MLLFQDIILIITRIVSKTGTKTETKITKFETNILKLFSTGTNDNTTIVGTVPKHKFMNNVEPI